MPQIKEELKSEIFWMLDALKKRSSFTDPDGYFIFQFNDAKAPDAPDVLLQSQIFNYLVEQKIIESKLVSSTPSTYDSMHNGARDIFYYKVKLIQPDFNNLYKKYTKEVTNNNPTDNSNANSEATGMPVCSIGKGFGYLQFEANGEKIKISKKNSQPFRLLQCLTEPKFGVRKSVDAIYESIRETIRNRYKAGSNITNREDKIARIETVFKEIQRGEKIHGRFKLEFDEFRKTGWLENLS